MQHSIDLFEEEEKYVMGRILASIFHNEENLYSVARIRVLDTNESFDEKEMVVTGYFPLMHDEEEYTFFGQLKTHPRYGMQYHVTRFRKELPQTKNGIVQYLSSDLFKGIGKKLAERIVEALGEQAISKIIDDSSELNKVKGITPKKAKEIYQTIIEHQGLEQVIGFLSQYGIGTNIAIKIYQTYREETMDRIKSNPYQLIVDVEGIGFTRADEIGIAFGISGKHPDRIRAGCLYALEKLSLQDGHVYITAEQLLEEVIPLLNHHQENITPEDIATQVIQMEEEDLIVGEDNRVYMPSLYYAEQGVVTSIRKMLDSKQEIPDFPEAEFLMHLGGIEEKYKMEYAPKQKEAIQTALEKNLLILTGGPGTGKTTVIKGIVELFASLNGHSLDERDYRDGEKFPIVLTAPTGRAAKRMNEATGLPATTIHRLLGYSRDGDFQYDDDNPIGGKLLIIDEFSMVDIWLANQLFKSLPAGMQVIMVGDEDQLPSVGPGQVLKDILASHEVPAICLTEIYRQAEGSTIIQLAHSIKNGELPKDIYERKEDRSYFPCGSAQVVEIIKQVCNRAKGKGYSAKDIQVLAPMYKGNAGINILNETLQEVFNPKGEKKREILFGETTYRVGDKVLQLVNRPEDGVYNGDMGEIVSIFYARENAEKQDMMVVMFDDVEVLYMKADFGQITLAYCCSIHKSQGSEFPIVVMPIVRGYYRMLRRNLLYTGITRSKQSLIICGEYDAFEQGIKRVDNQRQTTLCAKLKNEASEEKDEVAQESMSREEKGEAIQGLMSEEELEKLTPYDFME